MRDNENDIDNLFHSYLLCEVERSEYIRKDKRHVVMDHLLNKMDIVNSKNLLSVDDKRSLGINTRLKISRELVEVLNNEGIGVGNPKGIIYEMKIRARNRYLRWTNIARMCKSTQFKYTLTNAQCIENCDWCISLDGTEIILSEEFARDFDLNCKCELCLCIFMPILNFDE